MTSDFLMFVLFILSFLGVRGNENFPASGQGVDTSKMVTLIEERVNTSIFALRSEIQQLQNRITRLESRLDLQTQAVIFSVRFSLGQVSGIQNHDTLKFDQILTNVGQGYQASTGIFHAPVSGYYSFFISVYPMLARVQVCVHVENANLFCAAGNDISEQGANMAILHLNAGYAAKVIKLWGDTSSLYGTHWTTFSGFLVAQDDPAHPFVDVPSIVG